MHEAGCETKDCQSSHSAFAAIAEYRDLVNTETFVSFWRASCAQTKALARGSSGGSKSNTKVI